MIHLRFSLSAMLLVGIFAVAMAQAQEEAVFPIEQASIVDADGKVSADLLRYGLSQIFGAPCSATPLRDVKYPENLTPAALYGQVAMRTSLGYPGMSGGNRNVGGPGGTYCFAVDKTEADGDRYDVLYFDANGDRDLTNDAKIGEAPDSPLRMLVSGGRSSTASYFDPVALSGSEQDAQGVQLLPWLNRLNAVQTPVPGQTQRSPQSFLMLMSTSVRKAKIQIGEQRYEVTLGNVSASRSARAWLRPEGADASVRGTVFRPGGLQCIDDQFVTLSVDAKGEQLTVSPYDGEFGEIAIRRDEETPERLGIAANVMGQDQSNFTVGDYYAAELPQKLRLPVGTYRASLLVDCGTVRASLSSRGFDWEIRSGESSVLEFSDRPVVNFSDPKPGQTFRPGNTVRFRAMLSDRVSGMMIRGLYDTSDLVQQRTMTGPDGTQRSRPVYRPLVPTVKITDSTGKQVASGQMPFG